jgi:hypothetical protein
MTPGEEQVAFYLELALAVTQWAHVERALFTLCSLCVSQPNVNPLFFGFFAIENFRSKLGFTSKMLLSKYETDPRAEGMQEIFDRVVRCSSKRNKLVHRRLHSFINEKPGKRYALIEWPKFEDKPPGNAKPGMAVRCPSGALTLREINAIRFEFFALFAALTNLHMRLSGMKEPYAEAAEHPKRPLPIQQLLDQMHEVLGHPPKPSRRKSLLAGVDSRDKTSRT